MKLAGNCHLCGRPAMRTCVGCGLVTCKNCINGQSGMCYGCAPPAVDDEIDDY